MTQNQYNWSRKSLDELKDMFYTEIKPAMIRAGYEPSDGRPRYRWLAANGFSGLDYALREHHDLTLKEFFVEEVGIGDATAGIDGEESGLDVGYEWEIRNDKTIDAIQTYLRSQSERGELSKRTVDTRRSRLAEYARIYERLHGPVSLTANLNAVENRPVEGDRCMEVFDVFKDQLSTDQSRLKYLRDVQQFYKHLKRFRGATFNPLQDANDQFRWSIDDPDNPTVDRAGMRAIYAEADSIEDRLVVLGLGAWGLRPVEVASAHISQFRLNNEPYIDFEERKNGPGEVSLLFGIETLSQRIEDLDEPGWNGHLFPSARSVSGHRRRATINNRFKRLAESAGVMVDGKTPTAKMGRRFWYTLYKDAIESFRDQLEGVADDQGSSSVDVVVRNYLSADQRRQYRRNAMREELAQVFGGKNE